MVINQLVLPLISPIYLISTVIFRPTHLHLLLVVRAPLGLPGFLPSVGSPLKGQASDDRLILLDVAGWGVASGFARGIWKGGC